MLVLLYAPLAPAPAGGPLWRLQSLGCSFRCTLAPEPDPPRPAASATGGALLGGGWRAGPGELGAPGAPARALNRPPAAALRTLSQPSFQWQRTSAPASPMGWFVAPEDAARRGPGALQVAAASMRHSIRFWSLHYGSNSKLTALGTEADSRVPEAQFLTRQAQAGCPSRFEASLTRKRNSRPTPLVASAGSGIQTRIQQARLAHLIHPSTIRGPEHSYGDQSGSWRHVFGDPAIQLQHGAQVFVG